MPIIWTPNSRRTIERHALHISGISHTFRIRLLWWAMSERPPHALPPGAVAVRGPVLSFTGDPFQDGLDRTMVHEPDAIVAMAGGRITHFGPASRVASDL